jgi:hypothetical protein
MELWKKIGILTVALIALGIGIVVFELFFSQSGYTKQGIKLNAVSDSTSITLYSPTDESPFALELEVTGSIVVNDKVVISHSDTTVSSRFYELQKDSTGFRYDGDWYHNHVIVSYVPENSTTVNLLISYKFYQ